MAPLAQAFVRLRPQLSEAEVRTQAVRAGETAGTAMGRSMSSGVSRTFKAFAGLGAATGLVEAGRKVMEFADQFEGARARVETNTENIGASFAAVQKPLGDLDSKMSGLGFTITDTENSFAQLITATRDPAKSLRDVALAADIARGRHESLDQATQVLMRVETGHVAMLGRLGIATRDASGHLFTQAQALDALATAYGGNASKFAETFAGKQAAARAEIQQSATEIGVALLPAFADLANVVAHDVLPPIAEAAQWLDRNRHAIEPLVKVGLELTAMWKAYTIAARIAEAMTKKVGETAVVTSTRLVAEGAAGEKAAIGLSAEARAAAAGTRFGTAVGRFGPAALGAGAVVGGQMLGGRYGNELSTAGFATMLNPKAGLVLGTGLAAYEGTSALLNKTPVGNALDSVLNHTILPHALGVQFGPEKSAGAGIDALVKQYGSLDKALAALRAQNAATKVSQDALNHAIKAAQADPKNTLALSSAQDSLRQAMHQAAQAAADNGRALRGNSDAALGNRDAVRQQVTAALGVVDAMKAQGRSASAQASMLDVLTQAIETNATKTYGDKGAVDALLTSLGLIPGKAQAAASAMSAYATAALSADQGLDPKRLAGLAAADARTNARAKAHAKTILDSFTETFSPVVSKASKDAANKADEAAKAAAAKAKQRFNDLRQSMLGDLQSIKDAVKSTTDSLMGFASITNAMHGTDIMGNAATGNVLRSRQQQAAQLKQFASLYNRLAGLGLNADDLHQFITAGPDAIPAMQQILRAGRGEVRQLNALDRQIQSTAGRLGREDASSQNSALIHADLQKLPPKIATEFGKKLRDIHIDVNLREVDRRNGMKTVAAVS